MNETAYTGHTPVSDTLNGYSISRENGSDFKVKMFLNTIMLSVSKGSNN